jgi:hypothetical protein
MRYGNYLTHITVPIANHRPFHLADERETRLRLKTSTPGDWPRLPEAGTPATRPLWDLKASIVAFAIFETRHFRSRPQAAVPTTKMRV